MSAVNDWARSSAWGVVRGVSVHMLIYPLEVAKFLHQCDKSAFFVFREEGAARFYRGLGAQLKKTSLKQMWVWPLLTGLPPFFAKYGAGPSTQMCLTGVGIAAIDTYLTHKWESQKIKEALASSEVEGSAKVIAYWKKLSINWVSFLVAQRYLRERAQKEHPGAPLTAPELMCIGVQTALVVSIVSAPLDWKNTIVHAGIKQELSRVALRQIFRGWSVSAVSLTVHNIASVYLMDRLNRKL